MQIVVIIVSILILVCISSIYNRNKKIRKLRKFIKWQFGKKPMVSKNDVEKIGYYWGEYSESIPNDEKLDSITWNDLEMDKIFFRINNCNSFVGEQILYFLLHCLPKNNTHTELLEKKICFFASNDKEREEIQLLLSGLGKDEKCYYLPKFIANLDEFKISGIWRYRFMQVLLALSVLPAIILQNFEFLYLTAFIFAINLAIYLKGKIVYEANLDTLDSIIDLIAVGNRIVNTKKFMYESKFNDLKKEVVLFKRLSNIVNRIKTKKMLLYQEISLVFYPII